MKVGEETTAKYRDAVLTHRIRVAKCAQFLESVETIDDKATAERLKLARMTARLLEHHLRHLDQRAHDLRELPDPNRPVQTSIALADAT